MRVHVSKAIIRVIAAAAIALVPVSISAQAVPAGRGPASYLAGPKWDFFLGYSYLSPHATVDTPMPPPVPTVPVSFTDINLGGLFSVARYFGKRIGVQGEFGFHEWGVQRAGTNIGTHGNDGGFITVAGGVIARFRTHDITPFIHALANGNRVNGPFHQLYTWGPGATAGGGMDIDTPWFNHRFAIRIFQVDYEYTHVKFPQNITYGAIGSTNINAFRGSAGFVFHAGPVAPPPAVTLACIANPTEVFPGDPVTATATAGNLNPKQHVIYSWSGNGVTGNGTKATVNTSGLAPGSYSVQGTVKEGRRGKEGLKPWQTADCSAGFTVKEFEPPTISCSANPDTIQPGGTSTITAQGVSPQNRPLTYSYTATAGTVTGTGPTAEYSSAGAPSGAVNITCNVSDDKGHSATAQTTVTIQAPPPPPQPHTQALCSMSFSNDKLRPTRVDNEAKACLDQVALDLKQQADAKAVIVGNSNAREKAIQARQERRHERYPRTKVENFAAQRAVNAKDYLVTEQGIDASRISVVTGTADEQSAQNYLVPAGANFSQDVQGTTPVDESTVKPEARRTLPQRRR